MGLLIAAQPAAAQNQQDVAILKGLLPWADALDQRLEEERRREAQKQLDEIAQMEQSIQDREARAAAKERDSQQRAAAIRSWNPGDNPPPPLRAGEHIVTTRNGCRLVIASDPSVILELASWNAQGQPNPPKRISHKDYFATMLWSGDCEWGVASGFGALAEPEDIAKLLEFESAYFLGRALHLMKMPSILNGDDQFELSIAKQGGRVITRLLREDPFEPLWGGFLEGEPVTSLGYDGVTVATTMDSCLGAQGVQKKKFSGCNQKNVYPVYGISVRNPTSDNLAVTTYCPNPKTPQGCQDLWYRLAGPLIEKIKAAWQVEEEFIKQETLGIEQLSAAWLAQRQEHWESRERAAELAAEAVLKSAPDELTALQVKLLRGKYTHERNAAGLNALDELVEKREAAANAAQVTARAAQADNPTSSAGTGRSSGISCAEAVSELQQAMVSAGSERQFLDTASGDQVQEQILWITHWYNQAVGRLPQCAGDPDYRKRYSDEVLAVQRNCPSRVQGPANCARGANRYLDETQLEAALRSLSASGTAASGGRSSFHTGNCTTYEQCLQVENASGIAAKLTALPDDNVNLKTRGIIAASEFMMSNYQQCRSDGRCQQLVDQYRKTREDSLVVCQKSSADPQSCTKSPF